MRQALPNGFDIPVELHDTPDPLVILRWTALHTPHETRSQGRPGEHRRRGRRRGGLRNRPPAPHRPEACAKVGRPVVMVSNNAEAAIDTFLHRHRLRHLVRPSSPAFPANPS